MAAQAKYAEMPISCQPDKMTLWNKFVVDFSREFPEIKMHS